MNKQEIRKGIENLLTTLSKNVPFESTGVPEDQVIRFRIDSKSKNDILHYVAKHGLTVSDWLRDLAFKEMSSKKA
jgi:NRPS condensation-like uncharacterized protein